MKHGISTRGEEEPMIGGADNPARECAQPRPRGFTTTRPARTSGRCASRTARISANVSVSGRGPFVVVSRVAVTKVGQRAIYEEDVAEIGARRRRHLGIRGGIQRRFPRLVVHRLDEQLQSVPLRDAVWRCDRCESCTLLDRLWPSRRRIAPSSKMRGRVLPTA